MNYSIKLLKTLVDLGDWYDLDWEQLGDEFHAINEYNRICEKKLETLLSFVKDVKGNLTEGKFYIDVFHQKIEKSTNGMRLTKKISLRKNSPYQKIASKYGVLLSRLYKCGVLEELLIFISSPGGYKSLTSLLNHMLTIYKNGDQKIISMMRENINKLDYLAIKDIIFDIDENLETITTVTEVGDRSSDEYALKSFYSDGKQTWANTSNILEGYDEYYEYTWREIVDRAYTVKLENPKYVMRYSKSKDKGLKILSFRCADLTFDGNTLPLLYDELHSTKVWQGLPTIPVEETSKKKQYINNLKQFCILVSGSNETRYEEPKKQKAL